MMGASNIIPLFVVIPLAGAFLISLLGKKIKGLADIIGVISGLSLCVLSFYAVRLYNIHGVLTYSVGAWMPPIGIGMIIDGLSAFMLVTVNLVAFCVVVYSLNYMEKYTAKGKFYTLFFLMLSGMNGVIITGDMFNLFVFLEIAAVASYALVAFGTEKHELEAAFKYAVMGTMGSLFVLLGIAFLYGYTSTLNMADMGAVISRKGTGNIVLMVIILFLMGFGLKAALVPFHAWLPDAHPSAPAPISAMLSGVLIKALGVYALCRIFYNVIGVSPLISSILMFMGTLSMVVAGLLAIGQWDYKRLLAYSSISQIGYIILGVGLGTPLGILGGLFHLFNHSIFKSLLFLNSGAVEYTTGTRDLQQMGGLAHKMPVTGATGLIGSMSIAGIPPFSGFWSKLIIIIAAVEAQKFAYAFWAALISILTLAMYVKVLKYAFLGNLAEKWKQIKEVPIFMKLSMSTLAIICMVGGVLLFANINDVFLNRASENLLQGRKYAVMVFKGIRQ
ncbi:MAG: monovalent cation/H+ antiporter subunit D family protein [Candidatus Omnitrophota bacterium]|nr:MAG: monovalent cation/H+ antiporter subunit D family protein [Candidatus Omnitrophota bacterium]